MDTIITFCKDNFDFISLAVGIIGVLVGVFSVIQAKKEKRASIRKQIEELQAEKNSIKAVNGFDYSGKGYNMTHIYKLDKMIEELKKQLK